MIAGLLILGSCRKPSLVITAILEPAWPESALSAGQGSAGVSNAYKRQLKRQRLTSDMLVPTLDCTPMTHRPMANWDLCYATPALLISAKRFRY